MSHHPKHTPDRQPETSDDLYEKSSSLAESWGIKQLSQLDPRSTSRLIESAQNGYSDDFAASLDDFAAAFLEENCPAFTENIKRMRASRNPEFQQEVRQLQLTLFNQAKHYILDFAGLPTNLADDEVDIVRANIERLIHESQSISALNDDGPLTALGILVRDKEGRERFTYPEGLFTTATDEKWSAYLASVKRHLKAANDSRIGVAIPNDLRDADQKRRIAHDSLSIEIKNLLGLNWDLQDVRNLVSKMRDSRYPNATSGEKARTNEALIEGMTVVRALREHLTSFDEPFWDPEV